jgi:TonB family protein
MDALTKANLLAWSLQAGVIVLVAAPLPRVLGLWSPRVRMAYWRAVLVACLVLPLLQPWVVRQAPPLQSATEIAATTSGVAALGSSATAATPTEAPWPLAPWRRPLPFGATEVLVAGVLLRLGWLGLGVVTVGRLRRSARRLWPRPGSIDRAATLAETDAEFLVSATTSRPVTCGVLWPVVLVPRNFESFPEQEQTAIACHELLHVGRSDWLRNAIDEAVRAVLWFHPAIWWLINQIQLAREQVVDREAVRRLGARQAYLEALLRMARPAPRLILSPATLFLKRAHLRQRVTLLVKEVSMSKVRLAATFAVMAAVVFIGGSFATSAFPLQRPDDGTTGVQAAQQKPPATNPPSQGAGAPGSGSAGGARPGVSTGTASGVGGGTGSGVAGGVSTGVAGGISGGAPGGVPAGTTATKVAPWRESWPQDAVRVGGNIKPPTKTVDVKPVYPAIARSARVQGVVICEVLIGPDGKVADAHILRSIPLLDEAALDAVRLWEFTVTLLNGNPVPVIMTATVNFVLDGRAPPTLSISTPVTIMFEAGVQRAKILEFISQVTGLVVGADADAAPALNTTVETLERRNVTVEEALAAILEPVGLTYSVAGPNSIIVRQVKGPGSSTLPGGVPVEYGQAANWPVDAVRVGGDIKPPTKIRDVRPAYPEVAQKARVQGVVICEVLIGPEGWVTDARVLRSIPLLDQAAFDAVRQWEFTPTLLNGNPVPVIMTVTVNFTLK